MNWNNYYMEQAGGAGNSYDLFRGSYFQRGYGLGGTFRRFFSWIIPIMKKHALPVLKSGAHALGTEAVNTIKNIADDVLAGKNLKESAEQQIDTAVESLKRRAEEKLEGRGIKRDKKFRKGKLIIRRKHNSRKKRNDIFQ